MAGARSENEQLFYPASELAAQLRRQLGERHPRPETGVRAVQAARDGSASLLARAALGIALDRTARGGLDPRARRVGGRDRGRARAPVGDGPARAARGRRGVVQGVRADSVVRAAADGGALRALARAGRRRARLTTSSEPGCCSPTRARRSARSATRPRRGSRRCRCTPSCSAAKPRTRTSTLRHGVPDLRLAALPGAVRRPARTRAAAGRRRARAAREPSRRGSRSSATSSPRRASRRRFSTTTCTTRTSSSATGRCACSTGATRRSRIRSRRSS